MREIDDLPVDDDDINYNELPPPPGLLMFSNFRLEQHFEILFFLQMAVMAG